MAETTNNPAPENKPPQGEAFTQQFQHQPVSARVPEKLARGVFSTGVLVLDGPNEFVLDFLQGMTRPYQICQRVVIPIGVMDQLINATKDNLTRYTQTFGMPTALPKPPQHRPSIQEIYENFKLPEEMMSGAYSNNVMIGHSASEFFFDFITSFYPTAAVSARVFVSAPQLPRLLDTLNLAMQAYRRRQHPQPPGASPEPPKP